MSKRLTEWKVPGASLSASFLVAGIAAVVSGCARVDTRSLSPRPRSREAWEETARSPIGPDPGTSWIGVSVADVRIRDGESVAGRTTSGSAWWTEGAWSPLVRDTLIALLKEPVAIRYLGPRVPPDAGFSRGLPARRVVARALVTPDQPNIILIWGSTSPALLRWLLAHELGHVFNAQFLHDPTFQDVALRVRLAQSGSGSIEDPNEYFADTFRDAVLALRTADPVAALSAAEADRPGVGILARYLLTLPVFSRREPEPTGSAGTARRP